MQTYATFRPTGFDRVGLNLPDQQDWLVAPFTTNRDADCLTRANWETQLARLSAVDPNGETWKQRSFGHWACGHFDIVIVKPNTPAATKVEELQQASEDYPVLDEELFSRLEEEKAGEVWKNCYRERERVEYIRKHRSQFEFHSFADLLGCVRGKYFAGYACELLH